MRTSVETVKTGLIFRQGNEKQFRSYWSEYVRTNQLSPQYLLTNIDYLLAYSSHLYKDKSFIYLKNGQAVACVFLPIEEQDDHRTITIGNSFTVAPVFVEQKDFEKTIMEIIDQIAKEERVEKIMFRLDSLEEKRYPYNFLLNYDYLDVSLLGYLLDCQHVTMRRNHQRAVKKILSNKAFETFVMDKDNKDYSVHEEYRKLHHKAAGKITRSKESFDLQFKLLEEGAAALFGLKYQGKFVAFTYFSQHAAKAVSFSAADDPDFQGWPLYHIINVNALEYFRRNGVKEIDMGQPLNTSIQPFYHPDEKQLNISLFKTGFGGRFVPNFRGVKYYSRRAFREDISEFAKNYENFISE